MGKENDIDQLFKRGLDDPEIPFNELDWEKMARKLDAVEEPKKRRIVPLWIFTASGIAAALAVFLFWIFSSPVQTGQHMAKNSDAHPTVKPNIKTGVPAELPAVTNDSLKTVQPGLPNESIADNDPTVTGDHLNDIKTPVKGTKNTTTQTKAPSAPINPSTGINRSAAANPLMAGIIPAAGNRPAAGNKPVQTGINTPVTSNPVQYPPVQNPVRTKEEMSASVPVKQTPPQKQTVPVKPIVPLTESQILEQKANALANSKDPFARKNSDIERSVQKKMDEVLARQHNLILSAMAAPDVSTVPSGTSAKISTNVGALATYALGSKFSVTSGAVYAKKYYNSTGTYASVTNPGTTGDWEVKADCNVLDIPLNVNYKVLNKKSLSVSVNTGLSSYFMLKEKYQYVTQIPGQDQQVKNAEFDNQNQHIFGIANVSVSFDHQISDNLSIGVQPFAKLPLTGIGNNKVDLRSTGVSFSLNIGLFPSKKPGKLAANRYSYSQY